MLRSAVLALVLGLGVPLSETPTAAEEAHVVLVSIDGMRGDYLWDDARYHLKIPNLKALAASGSFADAAEAVTPTLTYASHASIVTGVYPARHGILGNTRFQPDRWHAGVDGYDLQDWYWEASFFKSKTLWQAAKEKALTVAAFGWPSTLGADIDWRYTPLPSGFRPERKDRSALRLETSTAEMVRRFEERVGRLDAGDGRLQDHYLALMAADVLREKKPHLTLIHFSLADSQQHAFGPASLEGLAAVEDVDQNIGVLLRAVREAGLSESTTFIITGDHGFLPLHTELGANIPLVEAGLLRLEGQGKVAAWDAIVHAARPFAAVYLKDRALYTRVWSLFEKLSREHGGIFRLLSREELDRLHADPGAAFGLEAEPGYTFDDRLSGAFAAPHDRKGGHGWTPARPGIETTFVASGRGIRQGERLPRVRLVDIAPTVARLLGLDLGPTDGFPLAGVLLEAPRAAPAQ